MKAKKKKEMPIVKDYQATFIEFLEQSFKNDPELEAAYELWKIRCESIPEIAATWLVSFHQILISPPPNLSDMLYDYGDVVLTKNSVIEIQKRDIEREALEWAIMAYRKFATYFFENTQYEERHFGALY